MKDEFYVVARKKGIDGPFQYVKCTSMKPWDGTRLSYQPDRYVPRVKAEEVKNELIKKGFEALLVDNSGLVDFTVMELSDIVDRHLKKK